MGVKCKRKHNWKWFGVDRFGMIMGEMWGKNGKMLDEIEGGKIN